MANLKEIRSRITSVKTTRQVTSAMKMVSAAKLRRAQEAIVQIRPYAEKLYEILGNLSESLDSNEDNPYSIDRKEKKILIVTINSNRGLCGGFNANVNKKTFQIIESEYRQQLDNKNLDVLTLGKKSFDFFRRLGFNITNKNDIYNNLDFEHVAPIVEGIMSDFVSGKYDKVILVYNEFVNAATQNLRVDQFLPIVEKDDSSKNSGVDYIFEPSKDEIVKELIPKSLKIQFYKAMLDSHAAEHGARMTAMHQATDNATDLINSLNLKYNKARQAAITNEILEIVSGAEALKG